MKKFVFAAILCILGLFFLCPFALANTGYTPTGYNLALGNEAALSATSAGWKGTFAAENVYWATTNVTGGGGGLDKQIYIDGVDLRGANKIIIYEGGYVSNSSFTYFVQIWDVANSTWRNLNDRDVALTNTADADRVWEVYDGYWQSGNNPVSTPLANFIDAGNNNRVALRIYSAYTTNSQTHYLDRMALEVAIDPYYEPANFTQLAGGAVTNTYNYAFTSDNQRITVANSGTPLQYYFSFANVKKYTGANAIAVVYEGAVNNASLTYNVQIYNFSSSLWENLNGTTLSSTTETTYYFAKSNVNLDDYISNGEVRIGIQSTAAASVRTQSTDLIYIIVGSVNTDAGLSEVSFGTEAGGTTAANTMNMDSSSANSTWQQTTATTSAAPFYAADRAGTWASNYSASCNLSFPVTAPTGCKITGVRLANRFRSNLSGNTAALSIKDHSGIDAALGGWVDVGSTNGNTTLTFYTNTFQNNPPDLIDTANNLINLRLRTSASTNTTQTTRDWDFAMVSLRWVEEPTNPSAQGGYTPAGYNLATGSEAALSATSSGWKGTLSNDTVYWATNNATGGGEGLGKQVYIENVDLKGANKIIIYEGGYVSNAALTYQVQIWDVANSTWRILNERNTTLANTADADRVWEIYDGYWQSGNSPVSTPLENFVDAGNNNRVTLRIYSAYTAASYIHYLDRLVLEVAVDPLYEAANFTQLAGGVVTNTYDYSFSSDNNRITVANTAGSALQYYFSFMNVGAYTGANAIMVAYEGLVSNAALTYTVQIYNFNTSLWENLNATTLSNTAEATYYFTKSNIAVSDYMSSDGEIRVGIQSNAPAAGYTHSTDYLYMIIGSVNADAGVSEVSFGTQAGGTTVANTRTLDTSAADSTWQQATATTSAATYYASDRAGTWNTNYSASSNLSFPVTVPLGSKVTGIRLANRFRSNLAANTAALSIRDYTGLNTTAAGGWIDVGSTNANATMTFYASTYQNNLPDFIDTTNNLINLRLRTSASTATSTVNRDWDFALVSIRWVALSGPTAAKIASLTAQYKGGNVLLNFTTEGESAVKGYQVYKTFTPEHPKSFIPVGKLIPAKAGPVASKKYSLIDTDFNINYSYFLGIINKGAGITYVGPVKISFQEIEEQKLLLRNGKKIKENTATAKGSNKDQAKAVNTLSSQKDVCKISIAEDGVYRITKEELNNAGIVTKKNAFAQMRLLNRGLQVPFKAGEAYIEFYARALHTQYSDKNIYWLALNKSGKQLEQKAASHAGSLAGYYFEEVKLEENASYYPEVNGTEHWFYEEELFSPTSKELEITIDNLAPEAKVASLSIGLQGFSSLLMMGNTTQKVRIYVNDEVIAEGKWNGDTYYTCQAYFDSSLLKEGVNRVTIEVPDDDGTLPQMILLDSLRVVYPRRFVAKNDELRFAGKAGAATYQVKGFSSDAIRVFDITQERNPIELTNAVVEPDGDGYRISFNNLFKEQRLYYAFAQGAVKQVQEIVNDEPSDIIQKKNHADYIIISHGDFIEGLKPLVALRAREGLKVKVVDVQEIYDAFNFGIFSPEAIKRFLRYAYYEWQGPKPQYVLLVGDGTYDYKDYYGMGGFNFIPPYLVYQGKFGEGPSDNWFVTFDNAALPIMMIGRLPVNTAEELQAVINKLIGYESQMCAAGKHLFVADASPERLFSMMSDKVAAGLPQSEAKIKLYLDELDSQQVRESLINEINRGISTLNYTGHGGISLWSSSQIFTNADVEGLSNANCLPFVMTLTCANGYFIHPQGMLDSLGEALLWAENKGAVGGVFPSVVSSSQEQEVFVRGFYKQVFNAGDITVGSAMKGAWQYLLDNNSPNVRGVIATYNLLGDPATKLKK